MKLLKNWGIFAIALLTISFTMAAHAGDSSTKKNAQVPVCDPANGYNSIAVFLKSDCSPVDPCSGNIPVANLYGIINTTYTPFECSPTGDIFCCAALTQERFDCDGDGTDDGLEVSSYICGAVITP